MKKLNYAEMGKTLTRAEMKQIMAGSGEDCNCAICYYTGECPTKEIHVSNCSGDPNNLCPTYLDCSFDHAAWGICY